MIYPSFLCASKIWYHFWRFCANHNTHLIIHGWKEEDLIYKTMLYFGRIHEGFHWIHMNNYPHLVAILEILCITEKMSQT